MSNNYAKDLFQLQTELIDAKVDMTVSKSIDRVVDLIVDLKSQVLDLKSDMNHQFAHLEGRFAGLESRVDMIEKEQNSTSKVLAEIRSKVIDYSFRGGWVILTGVVVLVVGQAVQWLHLIK